MRKILTFIAASALVLGMGSALADHHDSANSGAAVITPKKAPSFLFVLSAKKAQIKKGKDGNTSLVIKKSALESVIQFSDRPYRIIKYITGSDITKDWTKGENSFAADPPNAVLSGPNVKPHIVVINSAKITDDTLKLSINGLSAKSLGLNTASEVTSLVLVIDSLSKSAQGTSCLQWRQGPNCTPCGGMFQLACTKGRNPNCPCNLF